MFRSILFGIPAALLIAGCATEMDEPRREMAADNAVPMAKAAAPRRRAEAAGAMAFSRESGASRNNFSAVEGRQVAFSATLRISAPDVSAALRKASDIARELGGYAAEISDSAITLKIPVKKAEDALNGLEKIGSVTSRQIRAEDVTDTAFDLDMRIANLEKLHKKLSALVESAGGVKDILAVEKELARVTGELEKLKATRQNLQRRVDFVTFRIYFSASAAIEVRERKFLLPQLTGLGLWSDNLKVGSGEAEEPPFDLQLPSGFVPVAMNYSTDFFAIDGEDTVLSAVCFEQRKGADLNFWAEAAARVLRDMRGYQLSVEKKTDANGVKYVLFKGERMRGKQPMRYEASLRIVTHCFSPDEVHIVEILGKKERMEKLDLGKMHDSVE